MKLILRRKRDGSITERRSVPLTASQKADLKQIHENFDVNELTRQFYDWLILQSASGLLCEDAKITFNLAGDKKAS